MTGRRFYLKLAGLLLIFGTIAFLVIGPLLPRLIDISTYQQQIVTILEETLHRKISLGGIRFVWRFGPEFVINDLHLRERRSNDEFLNARRVTIHLGILPLLRHQIALRTVVVDGLTAEIVRDAHGALNISDLLEPEAGSINLRVNGIQLHQATIIWRDYASPAGPQQTTLTGLNLTLSHLQRGAKTTYKLSATLGRGTISGAGTIRLPKAGEPLNTDLQVNGALILQQLNYGSLWPYYARYIPFGPPGGTLDLQIQLKGTPAAFTANGVVQLQNARVSWPAVFHGQVAPKNAKVRFELRRTPTSLDLPMIRLHADGFAFRGSLKLTDLQSHDPYLSARGETDPFDYRAVRSYIPFGIIADDAAHFIEHKIKAGRFKLNAGTLAGRLSTLRHLTEGDNINALFISGTAQQAVVSYGSRIPTFNQISGTLELKGHNFNLQRMSGYFGSSPFTLEGGILDYCTQKVTSRYPFTMAITPHPAEAVWLARLAGAERLRFAGPSTLHLNGEGPIRGYRLSGDWRLTQASYEFPGVIRKPAGMVNNLSFSSLLTPGETRLTALSFGLPPLQLSAMATLRHDPLRPHLTFELQSNSFALPPHLPLLPDWQQYQPRGTIKAHLFGAGDPRDFSAMQYHGTINLAGFSCRPVAGHPPLSAINGLVAFKGNSLSTSNIAVRYGSTDLHLRGRIAALNTPEAELFVTSPELHPADFGIATAVSLPIRRFSADLGFRKGLYTIRNLSGRLPKTIFSAAGAIRPAPTPQVTLRVASSYLDLDELLPLLVPQQTAPATGAPQTPPIQLNMTLTAERGAYHDISFNRLKARFQNDGPLLQLQDVEAGIFGGHLVAGGQLIRSTGHPPQWNLKLALERVKSNELLHSLGIDRETKGLMTLNGHLRAQGATLPELKQSLTGNLALKVERGVLRHFNTLSKVFSLLNVSQLLSFRLPDMAENGMPFNQITATIGIKDGVMTSRDFFINSNAMHISMVGSLDIARETLNLLIGVQPLQTVDKVISRIPVVGWILTGGNGSLITTYFEAQGGWADPQVTAIPVKSMAKGTFDIFRRLFELPVRLFTDSGEVILGNQKERPKARQE